MTEKTVSGWLVFDWKAGSHRTRKSKPDDLGTHEIATRFELDVEIPEVDVPEIAAKVQVPQPRVQTAVLESLDEDAFPDWSDVAGEYLEAYAERIRSAESLEDVDDLVDQLTTKVLIDVEYAEPETVRAYLKDHSHRLHKDASRQGDL